MSDVDPGGATAPKPSQREPLRFTAILHGLPTIALAAGFLAMIFHAVPKDNQELVGNVISGLLGYLTHAVQTKAAKGSGQ